MKYVLPIALVLASNQLFSQLVKWDVTSLDKEQYSKCPAIAPPLKKPAKGADTIATDEMKFAVLGSFKAVNSFTLMKSVPGNVFYLTNNDTGWTEELLGTPAFSASMRRFACFGDASGRQLIRMYEIQKDKLNVKLEIPFARTVIEIGCVTDSSFNVKDVSEKYWRYTYRDAR